ncbi:hypothetical protein [Cellulomonas alba]|uniref:Uncharacterized protein n=1 Tax=Cellulomonas alba TaxID=3053467 RepID=A0ABT7SCH6_9CELL|nr:hypothetical protein [Cellulomonas alba]MDM7853885.1 hypothetical protein [Cellulomonas alba]
MVDEPTDVVAPVLGRAARTVGVVIGLVTLAAGGVAVFATDNEVGSAALVTAGAVVLGLAVFGNRVRAFEVAGVRLELLRQAADVRQEAEQARASGEVGRAEQLENHAQSLLMAAGLVGSRYERLRATEPPGWGRTSRMEQVLRDARDLDTERLEPADVEGIFDTGTDGNRIFALALIERSPRLATADVLVDAIAHSRSAFEQYHALVAAERALHHLSADGRSRVREAVESVLDGPLGESSSDRRTVARRVAARLAQADRD